MRRLSILTESLNHSVLILALVLLASGTKGIKVLAAFVLGRAASLVLVDLGVGGFPPAVAEVLCMATKGLNGCFFKKRPARYKMCTYSIVVLT
jgi:hypothetical protein